MVLFVLILECLPRPTTEDRKIRSERKPMTATDRNNFIRAFFPGIALTLLVYIPLTVVRDIRDNFEVEIWRDLGINAANIYTAIDSGIALVVLLALSLLILIKNNFNAFKIIHVMIIAGCAIAGLSTFLFEHHFISGIHWMVLAGMGLYFGYIPYNAIFFERMLATFKGKGNVGFVMYIADAAGYLGSVGVLLLKEFGNNNGLHWSRFYNQGLVTISVLGGVAAICSLIYFVQKKKQQAANYFMQTMPV
jgi:hypothetical protein